MSGTSAPVKTATTPGNPLHRGGALVVAASDRRGQVIDASSRGPDRCGSRLFPDVAAPGWEIPAPAPPRPESLTLVSGTSFAVGFVGGIAAMILQLQPEMPVADVEEIIRTTATDLPPAGHDPVSGYGLLNPKAAIDRARSWKPTNKM